MVIRDLGPKRFESSGNLPCQWACHPQAGVR